MIDLIRAIKLFYQISYKIVITIDDLDRVLLQKVSKGKKVYMIDFFYHRRTQKIYKFRAKTLLKIFTQLNFRSWLVVQNLRIALSRVLISFEAFRVTLIKKDRQNGEHRKGRVNLILGLFYALHSDDPS